MHLKQQQEPINEDKTTHLVARHLQVFGTVGKPLPTSLRRGAGMESAKELLGHASITTTVDSYGHLTVEDARQTLAAAGWFTGQEVRL